MSVGYAPFRLIYSTRDVVCWACHNKQPQMANKLDLWDLETGSKTNNVTKGSW